MTRIGITAGSFDLCHYGHILMFEDCLTVCDELIVCVQTDPTVDRPDKNKPIQSIEERVGQVKALRGVSKVLVYTTEQELYNILETESFDVRILGSDWEGKEFTGWDLNQECYFHRRAHDMSSTDLRNRVYEAELKKRTKTA